MTFFGSRSHRGWIRGGRGRCQGSFAVKMASPATESVQCFGRKKTAVAVAHYKRDRGLIKVNGVSIEMVKPEIFCLKAFEPILLLGRQRFVGVDIRIRVKGGSKTSHTMPSATRQSIAKALVAYNQKYVDEQSKKEIKDILVRYELLRFIWRSFRPQNAQMLALLQLLNFALSSARSILMDGRPIGLAMKV